MAHPTLTTTWPSGDALRDWLTEHAVAADDDAFLDELVSDASASIYEQIDPNTLPDNVEECPRSVARAIVLEAARLLYRRQSPHGVVQFGSDVALRLRTADVDVARLIRPYTLEPEP